MQRRFWTFTKNQNSYFWRLSFFALFFFSFQGLAAQGEMPVDDVDLNLPDGRSIHLKRIGDHRQLVTLVKNSDHNKVVLWKKEFEEEFDRLWDWAFFVPVRPKKYVVDINRDGYPEIGIATWDGGNNIDNRYALVFSVLENQLVYIGRRKFNLEYGRSLYP
jgi:hypothetical protein